MNGLLSDPFTLTQVCQGCLFSMLLYIIATEVLASFINVSKRIKEIQIGDHDIKIANFADHTTIFLGDITCHDRIQVILKLYEDTSSSKINFSKSQGSAKCPLKYLKLMLVTLFSIIPNGTNKWRYSKKTISGTERSKDNRKPKNTNSQIPSSNLHFDGWTRYFRQRNTIKLSKNKMDSKVIKSHQCSLEKSHGVLIELNSEL